MRIDECENHFWVALGDMVGSGNSHMDFYVCQIYIPACCVFHTTVFIINDAGERMMMIDDVVKGIQKARCAPTAFCFCFANDAPPCMINKQILSRSNKTICIYVMENFMTTRELLQFSEDF